MIQVFWIDGNAYVVKLDLDSLQKVRDLQHGPIQIYSDVIEKIIERGLIELTGELPENGS